ncbi:C2H2-type domain-containing protein [Fusarium sp. LHS14.1]|nr:C2H2-type domain-containing protein [Fusarium sp. LHS14.1]
MRSMDGALTCAEDNLGGGRMASERADPSGPEIPTRGRQPSNDKSFVCEHPGCTKRFTRAEHLQRHALNHLPGGSACPKCRAHFKRPDLLKRHMDRHVQKDLEAGGPGCGVLDTRKRSWKAPDGSVVEKRPCFRPETQQIPSPESEPPESSGEQQDQQQSAIEYWAQDSDHPGDNGEHSDWPQPGDLGLEVHNCEPLGLQSVSQLDYSFQASTLAQQGDHTGQLSESWDDAIDPNLDPSLLSGAMLDVAQLDYDQIFQPDTASSFNMPYTTALDYNWLFDMKGTQTSLINLPDKTSQLEQAPSFQEALFTISPESMDSSQLWPERRDSQPVSEELNNMQQLPLPSTNQSTHSASSELVPKTAKKPVRRGRRTSTALVGPVDGGDQSTPNDIDRPFSLLSRRPVLPQINETVRKRLLQIIEATNPCLPESHHPLSNEPLLSVQSLQNYLDLYFTRFNTAYPLIHLPTFDANTAEPLHLLSILLLGATYSNKDAHQLAVRIHDVMRPSIFAHAGFSPRPELWTLQTILLVECFGKSRAGQKQHDMSHLFHGLLINLIRRSDCQFVRPTGPPSDVVDHDQTLRDAWRRWSIAEQKKRLALLCFMWDTQHAVLFCQSLCMSAFELRVELPCSQRMWEAGDAMAWAAAWRSSQSNQGQFFLPALKSYMTPSVPRPQGLSGLSRVLLFHGLMSIAWDMQRRDQTALGVVSGENPGGHWRKLIGGAYETWKSDFDAYTLAVIGRLPRSSEDESQRSEHIAFATAYNTLYHSAQALLNMEFLDVQIYAGARNILGRPVQQKDYRRSARNVKQWASAAKRETSQDFGQTQAAKDALVKQNLEQPTTWGRNSANTAAWHAGRMLRDGTKILTGSDAMSLFHVPWCLYLATLTCWAFHHAGPLRGRSIAPGDEMADESSDESDEMVWDPRGEMEALVTSMAEMGQRDSTSGISQRRQTNGLVWSMAEILTKVRWEIVQTGVKVLRGLVPQRLINQYDDPLGDGF